MCKYCDPIRAGKYASPVKITKWSGMHPIVNSRAQILNEKDIDSSKAIVLYCGLATSPFWQFSGVPIKYCPWCGQKLEEK